MESHPEEDNHRKDEAQCHDALLGFFLRQFFDCSCTAVHTTVLLGTALSMTESGAENVVDGNGDNQRSTGHSKGEVVGIIRRVAQRCLSILLNLDGSRWCKEGTNIDSHVEDREARVALVGILRVVVEVAHHYLQVTLEQTRTETDEQQGSQHYNECKAVASQRNTEQQIASKHNDDTRGHHLAETELVGQHAAKQGEEVDEHEERTIDGACQGGRQSVVSPQKQSKDGQHGVVTETLASVGQCQRE